MGPFCPLGISRVGPVRKSFLFGLIINPSLIKLVWSRWLDIGRVFFFFCVFIDLDSLHKNSKDNLTTSSYLDLSLGQ